MHLESLHMQSIACASVDNVFTYYAFDSFSLDPTHRDTFWAFFIGGTFQMLPVYATNQTAVQRFLTSKSFKSAQRYLIHCSILNAYLGSLEKLVINKTESC